MDLNQINNFLSVAQTLSFSGAARRNGVPQSTVSRHICDLETELGVKLFYRTKRDVKLTDEGRVFLPYAKEIMETARKAAYVVKQLHEGADGRLAIAAVDTCDNEVLAMCLKRFGERYPDVLVDITDVSDGEPQLEEREDQFDFHFLPKDSLPEGDDFDCLMTHEEELAVVVSKDHSLAGTPLDFSALQNEKFLILSETENPMLYRQLIEICRAHHFTPAIANRMDSVRAVLLAVGAGLGVTILPTSIAKSLLSERIAVLPIDDMDTTIPYAAAWKKELLNPAAKLFLSILQEVLGKSPAE